jgi:hypothetical protein
MASAAKFKVHLFGFKGKDLPAKDKSGTSDPLFIGDFDKYKTFKSEWIAKTLNPEWKHEVRFVYSTQYPNKLDKKILKLGEFGCGVWACVAPLFLAPLFSPQFFPPQLPHAHVFALQKKPTARVHV